MLEEKGWNINVKDKEGNSLLHAAAWGGNKELVKYLQKTGLSLKDKNEMNMTPLDLALSRGNHEVEEWIVKHQQRRVHRPTSVQPTPELIVSYSGSSHV